MKEIKEFQNENNENLKIVVFEKKDIELLREFVLFNYNQLVNKDFFIIDDFDTSFMNLFNGYGYVIGMKNENDEIVALEACDSSKEIYNTYKNIIEKKISKVQIVEIGWSITRIDYAKHKIASHLIKLLEKKIENNIVVFVSTVHPENIAGLRLFLNLGYYGYAFKNDWHKVPRIFLVKTHHLYTFSSKKHREEVEFAQIEKYFNRGYILVDYINDKYIFTK